MHDPLVVAFEIRRPWPYRSGMPHPKETRWSLGKYKAHPWWRPGSYSPFWVVAGRQYYFPSLITIWHREPGGRDSGDVCPHSVRWTDHTGKWHSKPTGAWRWHVHHWKLQFPPLQALRRSLLTRCAWCGGRSRKRDHVNVSHQWDGPRGKWWRGEPGLFHHDCSSVENAHRTCICDEPVIEIPEWTRKMHAKDPEHYPLRRPDHGKCETCGRFRAWGDKRPSALAATRLQQTVPKGTRPSPEKAAEIRAAWAVFRTEEDAIREAEQIVEDAHRG